MNSTNQIYVKLFAAYGPQGWWPLLDCEKKEGKNPTKTGSVNGNHPLDFSYPKSKKEQFEICIGAILTQNTSWPNVEKALINLKKLKAIDPQKILTLDEEKLKEAIRPAGYFNQKAKKLLVFSKFYLEQNGKTPSRTLLLSLWGIGPETADSILLYAFKERIFVVDAYTKRIFSRLGYFLENESYENIQNFFMNELLQDSNKYNEYHALIVEHAKRHCKKNPDCKGCVLASACKFRLSLD